MLTNTNCWAFAAQPKRIHGVHTQQLFDTIFDVLRSEQGILRISLPYLHLHIFHLVYNIEI